jgi:Rha family phage regulatory protein
MQSNSIIPSDLHVQVVDGQPMVGSLDVARIFEKAHKRVLQDIRDLLEFYEAAGEAEWTLHQIVPIDFIDKNGDPQPAYLMTEEGFSLLALGYTGDKAKLFRLAYVREFVRMRNEISTLREELHKKEVELARNKALWDNRITAVMVNENPQKAINMGISAVNLLSQSFAVPLPTRQAFGRALKHVDPYFKLK